MADTPPLPVPTTFVNSGGELIDVDPHQVGDAIQLGWAPATPKQIEDRDLTRKYGTGTQQLATGAEAAGRALTFGLSSLYERAAGVPAADIHGRAAANPIAEMAGTTAGIAAPTLATAGAAALPESLANIAEATAPSLISRVGRGVSEAVGRALPGEAGAVYSAEAATRAALAARAAGAPDAAALAERAISARVATQDAGRLSRLIAGALPSTAGSAAEGAIYGAGNWVSEKSLGNPNANAQMLIDDVGLSTVMGGGLGALFGGGSTVARIALDDAKDAAGKVMSTVWSKYPDWAAHWSGASADDIRILSTPESRDALSRGIHPEDILRQHAETLVPPEAPADLVAPVAPPVPEQPLAPPGYVPPVKPEPFESPAKPTFAPIQQAEDVGLHAAKVTDATNDLLRGTETLSREAHDLSRPAEMRALASHADPIDAHELGQSIVGRADAISRELFGNPDLYPSRVFPAKLETLRIALGDDLRDAKPEDVYEALNTFKGKLDKQILQWDRDPSAANADAMNLLKGFRYEVKKALEDPTVWGQAGARQSAYNGSITEYLAAGSDAMKRFGEKFKLPNGRSETRFVTDKIQRMLKKLGEPANREDEQVFKRFVDAARDYHSEFEKAAQFAEDIQFDKGAAQGLVDNASGALDAAKANMAVGRAAEEQEVANAARLGEHKAQAERVRLDNKELDKLHRAEVAKAKQSAADADRDYKDSIERWRAAKDADKDRQQADMLAYRDQKALRDAEYQAKKLEHKEVLRAQEEDIRHRSAALRGITPGHHYDAIGMVHGAFTHPVLTTLRALGSPLRAIKTFGTIERITQRVTTQIDNDAAAVVRGTSVPPPPKDPSAEVLSRRQATRVTTPDMPRGVEARYAIVDAADVIPSHDAQSLRPNPAYPQTIGAAGYDDARSTALRSAAQDMDPAIVLSDTKTAVDGPPIVTGGGRNIVLGGNGRAMMIQRAYRNADSGVAYRQSLVDKAQRYGFTRADVEKYATPMLVRVVDDVTPQSARGELAGAVEQFAKPMQGSDRLMYIQGARLITPDSVAKIGRLLTDTDKTLSDVMRSDPTTFRDILHDDAIVSTAKMPEWVDEFGALTNAGKERIEGMFLGHVVGTVDRLEGASKSLLAKIERAVPSLLRVATSNTDASEIPTVQAAMDILSVARASGKRTVGDYLADTEASLYNDAPPLTPDAVRMASFLESAKPREVQSRFGRWAADAASTDVNGLKFGAKPTPDALREQLLDGIPMPRMPTERPAAPEAVPSMTPEAFKANAARIRELANDPNAMHATIQHQIDGIANAAPATATSSGIVSTRAMQFLASKLPTPPPGVTDAASWTPDDAAIAKFARYMHAVDKPTRILKQAANDTLTPEAVEAVKAVYPDMYAVIQKALLEQATKFGPMPYRSQLMMGMLLGVGAERIHAQVVASQGVYGSLAPSEKSDGKAGGAATPARADKLKVAQRTMTGTQRVASRDGGR